MEKYIGSDFWYVSDFTYQKLFKDLGYRATPENMDKIALCVNRLRMGEKPYALYGYWSNDRIVSQELGIKIGRDYKDGKLDFIEQFAADKEGEIAKRDPFRFTRYDIVNEAEEMAPYSLWNLDHMEKIGMSPKEAKELMKTYDRIKDTRKEAEGAVRSHEFRDKDGKMVMIETLPTPTMRKFRDLPQYLRMHYLVYYRTTYPEAPKEWAVKASEARAAGKLDEDEKLVVSADDIFRYKVWDQENLDDYFDGLARFSKTKRSQKKFIEDLRKRFGLAFSNRELKDQIENTLKGDINLDTKLQKFARSLGFLEDDIEINHRDDLSTVAPSWERYLNQKYFVDQGERSELDAKIEALDNRLAEFHITKIDEHGVVVSIYDDAGALLDMALKKLMDMAPTKKLPPSQVEHFIEESLQDMMIAHKEGDVYSWRPYEKIMTFLYPNRRGRKKS
jgi:hypothetical protein